MQGILLQIGYFERGLSKMFKKVNFIFLSNRMHVMRMPLVCTHMTFECHT